MPITRQLSDELMQCRTRQAVGTRDKWSKLRNANGHHASSHRFRDHIEDELSVRNTLRT
ncbi:hypothetical protein C7S13_7457 [Burkholderia cepacia]|nr:hypothetical protein [Burkholderia cepacia]